MLPIEAKVGDYQGDFESRPLTPEETDFIQNLIDRKNGTVDSNFPKTLNQLDHTSISYHVDDEDNPKFTTAMLVFNDYAFIGTASRNRYNHTNIKRKRVNGVLVKERVRVQNEDANDPAVGRSLALSRAITSRPVIL